MKKFNRSNVGLVLALFLFSMAFVTARCEDVEWRYRRSSIYNIMILHPEYKYGEELEKIFNDLPVPERFNDHSLGVKAVKFGSSDRKDQRENIELFLDKTGLAQKLVSKWFDRDKTTGAFDLALVAERGYYGAYNSDIALAEASARGYQLLVDAGEELIPNTYVVFNDVMYNSRSGVGSILKMFGNVYIGNVDGVQSNMQEVAGFKVTIKSYLYRLVWNADIADEFYNTCYYEGDAVDGNKKALYESSKGKFSLEYVGMSTSSAQKTSFVGVKDPVEAMKKICVRVIDRNLSDLQRAFPSFRIKAPLLSTEPLIVDIGMKEDVTEKSEFEVIQPEIDDKGHIRYNRVGIIRPVAGKIKDNRYMSVEEGADNATLRGTEFQRVSGGEFYPGMLVREL